MSDQSNHAEKRGRGRPVTGKAQSDADRARAHRERKAQAAEAEHRDLFRALLDAWEIMMPEQRAAWERVAPTAVYRRVADAVEHYESEVEAETQRCEGRSSGRAAARDARKVGQPLDDTAMSAAIPTGRDHPAYVDAFAAAWREEAVIPVTSRE